jgi:hypothetical protein
VSKAWEVRVHLGCGPKCVGWGRCGLGGRADPSTAFPFPFGSGAVLAGVLRLVGGAAVGATGGGGAWVREGIREEMSLSEVCRGARSGALSRLAMLESRSWTLVESSSTLVDRRSEVWMLAQTRGIRSCSPTERAEGPQGIAEGKLQGEG